MTPEEKALLENTYNLAKENNALLLGIKRSSRWSLWLKILYWVLIIALSVGAAHFFQGYLDVLQGVSGKAGGDSVSQQIQDLIN
jgi:hypothetical protein